MALSEWCIPRLLLALQLVMDKNSINVFKSSLICKVNFRIDVVGKLPMEFHSQK